MSKLIGCESPFSDRAGITEATGVDFEEDSTGILYHLEYLLVLCSFVEGE